MPANKKGSSSPMSAEHKAALAAGRQQGITVRKYLEALEAHKPKRGRKRTPDSIDKQLKAIEAKLASADPLTRLTLVQQRMDLVSELDSLQAGVDLSGLEADFVAVGKGLQRAQRHLVRGVARGRCRAGRAEESRSQPLVALTFAAAISDRSSTFPSVDPSRAWLARSGWGMRPTTLRSSLHTPAMSSSAPFGLSTYRNTTRASARSSARVSVEQV